jgi:type II secretory pathway pseudopilin PulG
MKRSPTAPRYRHGSPSGFASVWALVVLAVLTGLTAALTFQLLAARRTVDRRERQAQAEWLARSGIELAAARLLTDPKGYEGETAEVFSGSRVRIQIQAEKESPNTYLITSEARHPADGPETVARTVTRRFRRIVENDRVRLEVMAPVKKAEPLPEKPSP